MRNNRGKIVGTKTGGFFRNTMGINVEKKRFGRNGKNIRIFFLIVVGPHSKVLNCNTLGRRLTLQVVIRRDRVARKRSGKQLSCLRRWLSTGRR
jgi:hypothetical protein